MEGLACVGGLAGALAATNLGEHVSGNREGTRSTIRKWSGGVHSQCVEPMICSSCVHVPNLILAHLTRRTVHMRSTPPCCAHVSRGSTWHGTQHACTAHNNRQSRGQVSHRHAVRESSSGMHACTHTVFAHTQTTPHPSVGAPRSAWGIPTHTCAPGFL